MRFDIAGRKSGERLVRNIETDEVYYTNNYYETFRKS